MQSSKWIPATSLKVGDRILRAVYAAGAEGPSEGVAVDYSMVGGLKADYIETVGTEIRVSLVHDAAYYEWTEGWSGYRARVDSSDGWFQIVVPQRTVQSVVITYEDGTSDTIVP